MAKNASKEDERGETKVKEAKKKAKGKKKKKGLLERVGVKVEREATPEEADRQKREASILKVWEYMRRQIDLGVDEYFKTGESEKLREFVGRPALDALLAHLEQLRSSGLYLSQPERKKLTNPRVSVISDSPEQFVVQERFVDGSVIQRLDGTAQKACDSEERVIRATVAVNGQEFKLLNVIKVQRAEL